MAALNEATSTATSCKSFPKGDDMHTGVISSKNRFRPPHNRNLQASVVLDPQESSKLFGRYYATSYIFSQVQKLHFLEFSPVAVVLLVSAFLFVFFVTYHCLPLMQLSLKMEQRENFRFKRGLTELIMICILFVMFMIAYGLALFTPPGGIPESSIWQYNQHKQGAKTAPGAGFKFFEASEKKQTGERRHCKWCMKYKPDRSHHCRICHSCVLKMDHHCPWIINCVGWQNHKYFMLSLLYSSACSLFIGVAMMESLIKALSDESTSLGNIFLLLFIESIDAIISVFIVGFFVFHFWLTCVGMTTIEFCEKQNKQHLTNNMNMWDQGCWKNFLSTFGENPLLWFLPIDNRKGDGFWFVSESTRLLSDASASPKSGPLLKGSFSLFV